MHFYHYSLFLLAFVVVIIHSRFIERSLENEGDEGLYVPNNYRASRAYQSNALERYLRTLIALDAHDEEATPFERRTKAITKGDPREFMG